MPAVRESDQVWVLETNLDDLPAEVIGYCYRAVCSRRCPGCVQHADLHEKEPARRVLSVLAAEAKLPALEEILFRETTTFGIRRYPVSRHKLNAGRARSKPRGVR